LTNDERGERKGLRGESKECANNSEKGVIRNVNFVERKGKKKERRKGDEIMGEDKVNAEDESEGEDEDKGRDGRENKGEGEEEKEREGQGEGEGKGEKEEGEESTTADALRLMTPWSYQVSHYLLHSSRHLNSPHLTSPHHSVIIIIIIFCVFFSIRSFLLHSSRHVTSPHLTSPHFSAYFSTLISPLISPPTP
jgi:hypothetical protein